MPTSETTNLIPILRGELLTRVSSLDAGTVDQNIDPMVIGTDSVDDTFHRLAIRKVCCIYQGFAPKLFNILFRGLVVRISLSLTVEPYPSLT